MQSIFGVCINIITLQACFMWVLLFPFLQLKHIVQPPSTPQPPLQPVSFNQTSTHHGSFNQSADQSSLLHTSMSKSIPGSPDCQFTTNGPQLTPAGRFQVQAI